VFFTCKCIKIIIFYFLKIIFYNSASKWSENTKKILIWSKEKNKKKLIFFKSAFKTQKQTRFYETQLKKHVKAASQKLCFKLNFLVGLVVQNVIWFVTKYIAAFVVPQTQKQL
jgi:hypothetical protein